MTYCGTPGADFIIDQIALLPVNTDEYSLNLSSSYVVQDNGDSQIQVYGVVNNLLDTDLPNGGAGVGNYYDRFGRILKLGARVKF